MTVIPTTTAELQRAMTVLQGLKERD